MIKSLGFAVPCNVVNFVNRFQSVLVDDWPDEYPINADNICHVRYIELILFTMLLKSMYGTEIHILQASQFYLSTTILISNLQKYNNNIYLYSKS